MKKLLLILTLLSFSSAAIFAQTASRIIKMDKIADDDEDEIYLEITSLKVGESDMFFNESFTADENWLKNIKLKVKNVSGKPITCVAVVFGLLEGLNEELEPQMSWRDKLGLLYGDCSGNKKKNNKVYLKNNEEIELTYSNIDKLSKKNYEEKGIGKFHKAELLYGTVEFKNGETEDTLWRVPNNVRYFDENTEEDEN